MKKHRVVIIVAISLLIGLIAYLCATLDYFSIKKITVKNNKIVKISEIQNYANYSLGENIEITVEEAKDICYFEVGKDKFFVDSDFKIVRNKDRIDYSKIVKIVGANENLSKISNLKSDEKFHEFLNNLYTHKILEQLTEINVVNSNDITMVTKNEIKVFFGDLNDSEKKSNNISKILKEISTKSINTKMLDTKDPQKPFLIKENPEQTE